MKYLLDTHSLLWFLNGDSTLSLSARRAISDQTNRKYVSIASLWEIAIKISIGKLQLDVSLAELHQNILSNSFELLLIDFKHTLQVSSLPFHHRDPFDRIIIAQGLVEDFIIVTVDSIFKEYQVKTLW